MKMFISNRLYKFLVVFGLGFFNFQGSIAQNFSDSVAVGLPTKTGIAQFVFKLAKPLNQNIGSFKSVLFFGSPIQKENQMGSFLTDKEAGQFSAFNNAALVLVKTKNGNDSLFASLTNAGQLKDSINAGLARLGKKVNHIEIKNLPIIPVGFAAASRFAISVGAAVKENCAGIVSFRAYNIKDFEGVQTKDIPHLVLTGESSGPDVRNNQSVFFSQQIREQVLNQRASGALIHHSVEMNASQSTLKRKSMDLVFKFAAKAIEYRLPVNFDFQHGKAVLNKLKQENGYLGQTTTWDSFNKDEIAIRNFGGLNAQSSFWLFDQEYAQSWKAFMLSMFDSYTIQPEATPIIPYCSGQRPSALSANFRLNSSVTLTGKNYYRVEVSDVTGNFDNPTYPGRFTGTKLSAFNVDSMVQTVIFPDNILYNVSVPVGTPNRYKMRIVSTDPYHESVSTPEITNVANCGPAGGIPFVYLSSIKPYKEFYYRGDTLRFTVFKPASYSFIPGTTVRIDLSGKNYSFGPGIATTLFTGTPNFTSGNTIDSVQWSVIIPDTLSFGPRYRLKPFLSSSNGGRTSGNGHDITVVPNPNQNVISISTETIVPGSITQNSATCGGSIFSDGGSPISVRGVCWNTIPNPTVFLSTKTNDGTGVGQYTSNLTNLTAGTLYYVRAYATNAQGTTYGNERTFTTSAPLSAPVLSTAPVINILQTSATGGGDITNDGGSPVTAKGVCWSTTSGPTIANDRTEDGTGTGPFTSNISGLSSGTTYFVRAFATNSTGTGYGNEISFSTASVQPILPQVSIQQVTLINNDSARCGGVIGNDGGSPVTARGLVWDVNPDPTVNLSTKTISGSGTGAFLDWMTGLSSPTTYYVRAYGTNGVGTSYSDEISFTTVSVFNTMDGTTNMAFFPNPVKEFAILEIDKPIRISSLIFYSSEGKEINLPFEKTSEKSFRISTASLKSGIYFLKIGINGGSKTLKIVK